MAFAADEIAIARRPSRPTRRSHGRSTMSVDCFVLLRHFVPRSFGRKDGVAYKKCRPRGEALIFGSGGVICTVPTVAIRTQLK